MTLSNAHIFRQHDETICHLLMSVTGDKQVADKLLAKIHLSIIQHLDICYTINGSHLHWIMGIVATTLAENGYDRHLTGSEPQHFQFR